MNPVKCHPEIQTNPQQTMPESPKNPDRDDRHARRRGEEDSDLDGREAASLLYGGPESTDTDSDNNDDSTDAPSE